MGIDTCLSIGKVCLPLPRLSGSGQVVVGLRARQSQVSTMFAQSGFPTTFLEDY